MPYDVLNILHVLNHLIKLELDMEQLIGSKLGKEYNKTVYCHPDYLTYMQSTSCKMPGWMNHKLESRLLGEISATLDRQMTHSHDRKQRGTEDPLDEGERRVKKLANSNMYTVM